MKVTTVWQGLGDLRADFAALSKGMQGQALRGALRAAASPVLKRAKADSPSRRVRKSLRTIVKGRGLEATARIGAGKKTPGVRILHLLEKGVGPHVIRALNKRVLHFPPGNQGRGFAERVNHPGFKARPFFKAALPAEAAEATRKFESAARQIIAKLKLRKLKQQGGG